MRSSLALIPLILLGCSSSPPQEKEPPRTVAPLSFRQMTTTAHTHDGQSSLALHIDTAQYDRRRNCLEAHGVRATLTHRNTHTMTIHTPVAAWDKDAGRLSTQGKTEIHHPHGTLMVNGSADLRLDQHHLTLQGPLIHTLSF